MKASNVYHEIIQVQTAVLTFCVWQYVIVTMTTAKETEHIGWTSHHIVKGKTDISIYVFRIMTQKVLLEYLEEHFSGLNASTRRGSEQENSHQLHGWHLLH